TKLNDIAEGNSPGFAKMALEGGRKLADGKGPLRSAVEAGAGHLKDNLTEGVKGLFGTGGKGKSKAGSGNKPTVILESIDIGVGVRTAYDQWTQYQEFSSFARGVKSANRADDVTSDWQMKVFWSSRSWKAHTTQQVPDQRICWTSEGAKGTTKGVITFHELGENLTRVLLIIEYYPKGLFEKTGNIWRAQGRRARLDLKHFARFISIKGEATDGWRGEIQDGEVVRSHDDAVAEEEENAGASENDEAFDPDDEYPDQEPGDGAEEPDDGYEDSEDYEDEEEDPEAYVDEDAAAHEDDDVADEYAEDGYDDEAGEEDEEFEDGEELAAEDDEEYEDDGLEDDEVSADEREQPGHAGARSR
ncbi:SRPBCC family protein, partial [Streptomyces sp. NPDC059900]